MIGEHVFALGDAEIPECLIKAGALPPAELVGEAVNALVRRYPSGRQLERALRDAARWGWHARHAWQGDNEDADRARRAPPGIGDRVQFRPSRARYFIEATVTGHRREPPRSAGGRSSSRGWVETRDDKGAERSVRPSQCTVLKRAKP